jgi:hypothetical protein
MMLSTNFRTRRPASNSNLAPGSLLGLNQKNHIFSIRSSVGFLAVFPPGAKPRTVRGKAEKNCKPVNALAYLHFYPSLLNLFAMVQDSFGSLLPTFASISINSHF